MKRDILTHQANLEKHGIDEFEAIEALEDGWTSRRRDGENFEILGRTSEGRYLQLVTEVNPESIRIFHGRDMTPTERKRYQRK